MSLHGGIKLQVGQGARGFRVWTCCGKWRHTWRSLNGGHDANVDSDIKFYLDSEMATELATPTLCEISYDDSDHMLTPYRYQLWQSPPKNTAHSSGQGPDTDALRQVGDRSPDTLTTTFSLPPSNYTSSYLDYLRTLYECRTSCSSKSPKTPRVSRVHSIASCSVDKRQKHAYDWLLNH